MMVEHKLRDLGIELPNTPAPAANYVTWTRAGNLVFLAGHVSRRVVGKLGRDLTADQGYQAAREVTVNMIATLKDALGDLDRVRRIVKVVGMVNAVPDFTEHPQVVNGCSDLLVAAFGDRGRHARTSVGMGSLPMGAAVELELVAEVEG